MPLRMWSIGAIFASLPQVFIIMEGYPKLSVLIEALIFASAEPVSVEVIHNFLLAILPSESLSKQYVNDVVCRLTQKYDQGEFAMHIREIGGGYQFVTKPDYHDVVKEMLKAGSTAKLSTAALETLAIIAYRQPVTKSDIELIRGVNCDYTLQKLLEKEMIEISGRSREPGRPLIYVTSKKFMEYFGLAGMKDLPKLSNAEKENEFRKPEESASPG